MGVHGILESMNWIDEELMELWDDRDDGCSPGWPDEDSRWHGVTPSPVDPRPLWEQDGWPSAEAMQEAREGQKEKLSLDRAHLNNEFGLEEDLWTAIQEGDTATLEYLLDQGTDPHMLSSLARTGALATACELGQLECAKLLREYGAYLTRDYDSEGGGSVPSPELLEHVAPVAPTHRPWNYMEDEDGFRFRPRSRYGKWAREEARRQAEHAVEEAAREEARIPVREWLLSRPPRGSKGPKWSPSERGPLDPGPWQSWEERFPPPPGVKEYAVWDVLSWHQALRAADPVRRRWARVRKLVKKRGLALYWQERTQVNLCAAGGQGRASDKEAFEEGCLFSEC